MCAKRDFRPEIKQRLLATAQTISEEDSQFWIFSGMVDYFSDYGISDRIADYENNIAAYHRAVMDKKDAAAEQINRIWANVESTDEEYAPYFQFLAEEQQFFTQSVQSFADALNPNIAVANGVPVLIGSPEELKRLLIPYHSLEEEKEADLAMQNEVLKLLERERFSRQTWNNATPAEREQILQEYYDEVQVIMGTSALPDISFESLGLPTNTVKAGRYSHDERTVRINSYLLADERKFSGTPFSSYHLFETVVHELRHAYQYEAVDAPGAHVVSSRTRQVWENNFKPNNYTEPHVNYEDYFEQPVEWDAKGFSSSLPSSMDFDGDGTDDLDTSYEGSWPK